MAIYLSNAFSINMINGNHDVSFNRISVNDAAMTCRDCDFNTIGHVDLANVVENEFFNVYTNVYGEGAGFYMHIFPQAERMTVTLSEEDILIVAQYSGPRLPEGTTVLPENANIQYWEVRVTY